MRTSETTFAFFSVFLYENNDIKFSFTIIFPSEGFSGGGQSSVAGYSQLPFPAASQTHLRSGIEGRWEILKTITIKLP